MRVNVNVEMDVRHNWINSCDAALVPSQFNCPRCHTQSDFRACYSRKLKISLKGRILATHRRGGPSNFAQRTVMKFSSQRGSFYSRGKICYVLFNSSLYSLWIVFISAGDDFKFAAVQNSVQNSVFKIYNII